MRKLLATTVIATGLVLGTPVLVLGTPAVASAAPSTGYHPDLYEEPVYCGPGYVVSGVTCKPRMTNDCVVWWKPWTWAKTDCVS